MPSKLRCLLFQAGELTSLSFGYARPILLLFYTVTLFQYISHMLVFYPRDAVLALELAMARVCLSVCLYVCHKSEFCRKRWTNRADFETGTSIHLSGLRKFSFGISTVETCYQLSSAKVDAQNWTIVGQKLTIPSSSDARPL